MRKITELLAPGVVDTPAPVVVLQDSGQVALVLQEASRKGSSVKAEAILARSRP